ncbi:MAG: heterodisulfide reductase-related iron-sulfur binding cluster [Candidatus Marinimicrobia bacterium]|nr:heterodisulfide reductase-related iron-sulfur binding cluster [Candidatus Neomarinimicrobiota bacterium]MDP6936230.1 heterodisulfide reductase-related iron-sulfur binding cluster [Candidatus Neomarinimicrobiota bacterium]
MNHSFSLFEQVFLVVGLLSALGSFAFEVGRRIDVIATGTGSLPFDKPLQRIWRVIREVLLHEKVIRGRLLPGLMHGFVFWGFMVFGLVTIDHFAIGFEYPLLSQTAHHLYSFIVIPFSLLVIAGILYLAYRRFVLKPVALGKMSPTSGLVAVFITVLMLTYLFGELNLSNTVWKVNWWLHSLMILAFLFLIPRSKHLHLVLAPFNIFFKPFDQPDHSPVKIDMEASEEELDKMLSDLGKMTQNQALDIFSCVECGRCMDACPANRGGGILDPKHHFILDLRDPILESGNVDVLSQVNVEAGWECTTCQACTEVCPVGNQVEKSDEIRRLQVLVEGNVPQEYQKLFNNLQNTGNTEGATSSSLVERLPKYTPEMEYVLWLGCFARYELDPNFTTSVENFAKILDTAEVSYGILEEEHCSGEPANRLGDKLTFAMLREHNTEILQNVTKIVSMCPHCVVNLEKEYAKYGQVSYKVEHHSQVIGRLIEEGKIAIKVGDNGKVTYHDPCNLSRMLEEVDAPRTAIQSVTDQYFELPESGKNTLCCGAGGGLWWKKETEGRTHLVRAEQVVDSDADTVVTGCNFCYGMMNQGLGPLTPEGKEAVQVKDISDIVAENLL